MVGCGSSALRIYVLSEGHCVEQGTHQDLMARQGHYYNMASLQSLGMRRVAYDLSHCDTKIMPFVVVCRPW